MCVCVCMCIYIYVCVYSCVGRDDESISYLSGNKNNLSINRTLGSHLGKRLAPVYPLGGAVKLRQVYLYIYIYIYIYISYML